MSGSRAVNFCPTPSEALKAAIEADDLVGVDEVLGWELEPAHRTQLGRIYAVDAIRTASAPVCQRILDAAFSGPMSNPLTSDLIGTAYTRPGADFVRMCVEGTYGRKTPPTLDLTGAASHNNLAALDYLLSVVEGPDKALKALARSSLVTVNPPVTTWIIDRLAERIQISSIAFPIVQDNPNFCNDSVRSLARIALEKAMFVHPDSMRVLLSHPVLQSTIKDDLPAYMDAAIDQAALGTFPKPIISPALIPIAEKMLAIGCQDMLDKAIAYAIRARLQCRRGPIRSPSCAGHQRLQRQHPPGGDTSQQHRRRQVVAPGRCQPSQCSRHREEC